MAIKVLLIENDPKYLEAIHGMLEGAGFSSFDATPQQTFEQYSLPSRRSREPTHWMNATFPDSPGRLSRVRALFGPL